MEELLSGRIDTPDIVRLLLALNLRPSASPSLRALPASCAGMPRRFSLPETNARITWSTLAAPVAMAAARLIFRRRRRCRRCRRSARRQTWQPLGKFKQWLRRCSGGSGRSHRSAITRVRASHSRDWALASCSRLPPTPPLAMPGRRANRSAQRTVFNLLGRSRIPPGRTHRSWAFSPRTCIDLVAATLVELGVERAFVVHGCGGLDEISLAGETQIAEVREANGAAFHALLPRFWLGASPAGSPARRRLPRITRP